MFLKTDSVFSGIDSYKLCTNYEALMINETSRSVLQGSNVTEMLNNNAIPNVCNKVIDEVKVTLVMSPNSTFSLKLSPNQVAMTSFLADIKHGMKRLTETLKNHSIKETFAKSCMSKALFLQKKIADSRDRQTNLSIHYRKGFFRMPTEILCKSLKANAIDDISIIYEAVKTFHKVLNLVKSTCSGYW